LEVINLEIRKASKEDIIDVSRVYVDSWRTTYRGLIPDEYLDQLSYQDAEKRWEDFLNKENSSFIYIAINSTGKIIGFASGKSIDDKCYAGELYSLYLFQECRGLGVGKKLITFVAKHFKEKGIDSMMVWVMLKNKSGLGFYKHLGGKEYIRRTSSFGGTIVEDIAYGWKDVSKLSVK